MLNDQSLFLTQLVTLWAVLDPIGHLPLFIGVTTALDAREKRRAAVIAILIAFGILVFFALAGQLLLQAMGISLLSFQIAGGIILFLFAITMVLGETKHGTGPASSGQTVMDIAVYPLATPIIAGPGAMLTIVLLTDNNRFSMGHQAMTLAALVAVLAGMLAIFLLGSIVQRLIGTGGANVLRRTMGLILAALAVNLVLNALTGWLKLPPI
ncbi:MarC family protein [Chelatococcus sp. GCM10030263]|uniref:MarC family protein n=1 Tax=Chelatococcus sp. GCM10030263 TaxID=3273387 RepID=UPI00360BC2FB